MPRQTKAQRESEIRMRIDAAVANALADHDERAVEDMPDDVLVEELAARVAAKRGRDYIGAKAYLESLLADLQTEVERLSF